MQEREPQKKPNIFKRVGINLGLTSTFGYFLDIAADPNSSQKKYKRLFKDPDNLYNRGYGPGLTEEQKAKLAKVLNKKIQDHSGKERLILLLRLTDAIDNNEEFNELIDNYAVKLANNGELEPEFILKRMGVKTLAKVNPDISRQFLEGEIEKSRKPTIKIWLRGLVANESTIGWIPLVVAALEKFAPHSKTKLIDRDRYQSEWYVLNAFTLNERVEKFFAEFPYPQAMPYLLQALKSDVHVIGDKVLSEKVVGEKVVTEHETSGHDMQGEGADWDQDYKVFITQSEHAAYYPIAQGARRSLLKIMNINPSLTPIITESIKLNDEKPKPTYSVRSERKGPAVGNPHNHRYDRGVDFYR